MSKCDFNKVALQLYWNHTLAWVFSYKFAAYFQNTHFIKIPTEGYFWIYQTYQAIIYCLWEYKILQNCYFQPCQSIDWKDYEIHELSITYQLLFIYQRETSNQNLVDRFFLCHSSVADVFSSCLYSLYFSNMSSFKGGRKFKRWSLAYSE